MKVQYSSAGREHSWVEEQTYYLIRVIRITTSLMAEHRTQLGGGTDLWLSELLLVLWESIEHSWVEEQTYGYQNYH
jgi:hypothetical protein